MRILSNLKNIQYKHIALLFAIFLLFSCGTERQATWNSEYATSAQNEVVNYSMQYLHRPYKAGGKGPHAFDCSGFTSYVFKKFGYKLGASSEEQDRQVPTIQRKDELQIGDLVFFEGQRRNGKVGHVGIVTEIKSNGAFKFIHATINNGVIISSSTEPYYASRYLRGGRVLKETTKQRASVPARVQKNNQKKRASIKAIATDSATIIIHSRPSEPLKEKTTSQSHNEKKVKSDDKFAAVLTRQTAVPPPEEKS